MTDKYFEAAKVPSTITSASVWLLNILMFGVCWFLLSFPLGGTWAAFVTAGIVGIGVFSGTIAEEIPDFHGAVLFNPWTKTRRVLFAGLHLKLPWEKLEPDTSGDLFTSLVRVISSKETKGHPTNDPAENMEASLLIHMRLDTSGTAEQSARNLVKLRNIDEKALAEIVRTKTEKMFGEHFAGEEMEDLLKPSAIEEKVLTKRENVVVLDELKARYGINIGVDLESSRPDDATKALKGTPAMAEALRTARRKLMEKNPKDANDKPLDEKDALRTSLLLDKNTDYTEQRVDLNVNVDAPHLTNLRDVNIIPPGTFGKDRGGKK